MIPGPCAGIIPCRDYYVRGLCRAGIIPCGKFHCGITGRVWKKYPTSGIGFLHCNADPRFTIFKIVIVKCRIVIHNFGAGDDMEILKYIIRFHKGTRISINGSLQARTGGTQSITKMNTRLHPGTGTRYNGIPEQPSPLRLDETRFRANRDSQGDTLRFLQNLAAVV